MAGRRQGALGKQGTPPKTGAPILLASWWRVRLQVWGSLGRKVMTNLDSIFKSRDITLPTKVCLVKAMVFPVVMYGCESWTVKKAEPEELMLLNCGVGENS